MPERSGAPPRLTAVKFGIMFANLGEYTKGEPAVHLARTAEEAGFDSIWAIEHVVVPANYESTYPYDASGRLMAQDDDVTIPDPRGYPARSMKADPFIDQPRNLPAGLQNLDFHGLTVTDPEAVVQIWPESVLSS